MRCCAASSGRAWSSITSNFPWLTFAGRDTSVFRTKRQMCKSDLNQHAEVTDLPQAGGGAQTQRLLFISPGLEQVLEHGGLSTLTHHLHAGAGRVVLCFDVTLIERGL